MKFRLELINNDTKLDIKKHLSSIKEVIQYILDGKRRLKKPVFKNIYDIQLLEIKERSMIIEENDDNPNYWHTHFGKRLAEHYNMRNFCNPKNLEELFYWKRRSQGLHL